MESFDILVKQSNSEDSCLIRTHINTPDWLLGSRKLHKLLDAAFRNPRVMKILLYKVGTYKEGEIF